MKNLAKKLLAIIATLAVVIGSTLHVNAAAETIQLGPAKQVGKYIGGVTFSYKFTTDGRYLYCVNMHKNTAQNTTADLVRNSSVINGGTLYILKNGYPEKSITGDADKDYYITQTAIWWYLDETTGSQNLGEYFKETGSDAYNMRHLVKKLVQEGLQHRNDPIGVTDTKLNLATSNTELKLNGDSYVSEYIINSNDTNVNSYTVKVTGAPAGTQIVVGNAVRDVTTTINKGEKFIVKVPKTSVTQDLSFKVTASATGATQYMAYEYKPRKDQQNVALLEKESKTVNAEITLNIKKVEEEIKKVTIVKIDASTKQPLAGAVLVVKDANGKEVTRWTSTTNAHVLKNLPNGTYTLSEEKAPEGYKLNTNVSTFTVSDTNKNIRINFENAPKKVMVSIAKVDSATGSQIAGAVLVVKDSQGQIVYKFTSTNETEVITDIDNGTYTVEEISAPDGYIKSDKVVTFTIDDSHLSHYITFENSKEVIVPDTASGSEMILIILGIVITGFGFRYIYKNGQKA